MKKFDPAKRDAHRQSMALKQTMRLSDGRDVTRKTKLSIHQVPEAYDRVDKHGVLRHYVMPPRKIRDAFEEANRQMLPDDQRYPQEDDE